MAWQELLALFQGSSTDSPEASLARLITKLEELIASLETVELADEDKEGPPLTRAKWRAASLSCQPLEELEIDAERGQRTRLRNARKLIQATQSKLANLDLPVDSDELQSVRDEILSTRRELELIGSSFRASAKRSRVFRGSLLLAPALLGGASLYYLRADRGWRLERVEVIAPSVAYSPVVQSGGTLTPRGEFLNDFMTEFSKYYFGHASQFESLYFDRAEEAKDSKNDKPDKPNKASEAPQTTKRRTLQHKINLRNISHGHTAYLSSISAVVDVMEKAEFPWTQLTVTPHITAATDVPTSHRSLIIKSDGIGPALDVKETVTTSGGIVLSKHERPILHRDAVFPFQYLQLQTVPIDGAEGTLAAPLYYRLNDPPSAPGPQYFEVKPPRPGVTGPKGCAPSTNAADYGHWEEVRKLSRLRQITPTAHNEPYTLEVKCTSLKGDHDILRFAGTLDGTEAFWTSNPQLRSMDPRCNEKDIDVDNLVDEAPLPLEKLAFLFAPEKELTHPHGTDLVTAKLGIDLLGVSTGRHVSATQPLDSYLNPQGLLSIQLALNMPSQNRYAVRVLLNGRESASYRFDALVPEYLTFADEGPTNAVARLRKLFDADQRRNSGPTTR